MIFEHLKETLDDSQEKLKVLKKELAKAPTEALQKDYDNVKEITDHLEATVELHRIERRKKAKVPEEVVKALGELNRTILTVMVMVEHYLK